MVVPAASVSLAKLLLFQADFVPSAIVMAMCRKRVVGIGKQQVSDQTTLDSGMWDDMACTCERR